MNRLRRFFLLTRAEQGLLMRATLWLGAIRVALWLLPSPSLRYLLAATHQTDGDLDKPDQDRVENIEKVLWAVAVAKRYVPGGTSCLTQALVVRLLLRQCGYPTRLRIGVARTQGGQLEAHAWVENKSQVVFGGSELSRYTPLESLEGGRR